MLNQFFPESEGFTLARYVYVCTTAQQYIGMHIRLSKEIEVKNLRQFGRNIIPNSVCPHA